MKKKDVSRDAIQFSGIGGKLRLLEAVKSQVLIAHDEALAKEIIKKGAVEKHAESIVLTEQGDPSNDLLFVLSGAISIRVNGREVATRRAGTHVGEMALVDVLARRSATAVTLEPSVTLRLTEHSFSQLASKNPRLWRRVAVEIANRLRERSAGVRQPNNEPVVFIASSSEGVKIAEEIAHFFDSKHVVPKLWSEGVFQLSQTNIESLVGIANTADFAVIILGADDMTTSRSTKKSSPRDNVIFELGLFMGALGRDRCVILKPKNLDVKIPTDLLGLACLDYSARGRGTLRMRLRPVHRRLESFVSARGSR